VDVEYVGTYPPAKVHHPLWRDVQLAGLGRVVHCDGDPQIGQTTSHENGVLEGPGSSYAITRFGSRTVDRHMDSGKREQNLVRQPAGTCVSVRDESKRETSPTKQGDSFLEVAVQGRLAAKQYDLT
jgi:hypothetical protein